MLSSSDVACQGWVTKYLQYQVCLSAAALKEMEFHPFFLSLITENQKIFYFHTFFSLMNTILAVSKEACPMLQAAIGSLTLQWHALLFVLH